MGHRIIEIVGYHDKSISEATRELYLTFDDGIEAGTEEVLDLLKQKGVRGTFFLIGKKVESAFLRDREKCLKILRDIYENHAIGNHSYSHANEYYTSFYETGLRIGTDSKGEAIRRSVVDDFKLAKEVIMEKLVLATGDSNITSRNKLLAKNQKKSLLRFPGTNTWYIKEKPKDLIDIKCIIRDTSLLSSLSSILPSYISTCKEDTKEEAEELKDEYNIFGWDCEWQMKPPHLVDKVRTAIDSKINAKTFDYNNLEHIDPYFDLYSTDYCEYDRPKQSSSKIGSIVQSSTYKYIPTYNEYTSSYFVHPVVLLMHEREFRKGKLINKQVDKEDTTYLDRLGDFIDQFKKRNTKFKTLDEY